MTTPTAPGGSVPEWKLRTCLLCGAPEGPTMDAAGRRLPEVHEPTCPVVQEDQAEHLSEALPDGSGTRGWTMSGLKYNATVARRERLTLLFKGDLRWHHAIDHDRLPFSIGALLNEIVPKMGISQWLARYAYNPTGILRVPDCRCTDVSRCRHDFPDHPFQFADPDFWPGFSVFVLRCRTGLGWWDLWWLDTGTGAVFVASDDITNDPIPAGVTKACAMGWCHKCPGDVPGPLPQDPRASAASVRVLPIRVPCAHACKHDPPG